jgi:hypothetical protein
MDSHGLSRKRQTRSLGVSPREARLAGVASSARDHRAPRHALPPAAAAPRAPPAQTRLQRLGSARAAQRAASCGSRSRHKRSQAPPCAPPAQARLQRLGSTRAAQRAASRGSRSRHKRSQAHPCAPPAQARLQRLGSTRAAQRAASRSRRSQHVRTSRRPKGAPWLNTHSAARCLLRQPLAAPTPLGASARAASPSAPCRRDRNPTVGFGPQRPRVAASPGVWRAPAARRARTRPLQCFRSPPRRASATHAAFRNGAHALSARRSPSPPPASLPPQPGAQL